MSKMCVHFVRMNGRSYKRARVLSEHELGQEEFDSEEKASNDCWDRIVKLEHQVAVLQKQVDFLTALVTDMRLERSDSTFAAFKTLAEERSFTLEDVVLRDF
jgi:hypothetical protein